MRHTIIKDGLDSAEQQATGDIPGLSDARYYLVDEDALSAYGPGRGMTRAELEAALGAFDADDLMGSTYVVLRAVQPPLTVKISLEEVEGRGA